MRNIIYKTNSILVAVNKKVFTKNECHPNLEVKNPLEPSYRLPGLALQQGTYIDSDR